MMTRLNSNNNLSHQSDWIKTWFCVRLSRGRNIFLLEVSILYWISQTSQRLLIKNTLSKFKALVFTVKTSLFQSVFLVKL